MLYNRNRYFELPCNKHFTPSLTYDHYGKGIQFKYPKMKKASSILNTPINNWFIPTPAVWSIATGQR